MTRANSTYSIAILLLVLLCPRSCLAVTFVVNTTVDSDDAIPGDGYCADLLNGDCSLRAAVREANALAGFDSIVLPAGTFVLTIAGSDDTALAGDLDLLDDIEISGAGIGNTILDPGALFDRIFDVHGTAAGFYMMTIQNVWVPGYGYNGGGILARDSEVKVNRMRFASNEAIEGGAMFVENTDLTVKHSIFENNVAINGSAGIAIHAGSTFLLEHSEFLANNSNNISGVTVAESIGEIHYCRFVDNGWAFEEGALRNHDQSQTLVTNTLFEANQSHDEGGAIINFDADLTLRACHFLGNTAEPFVVGRGGAIFNFGDSRLLAEGCTFEANEAVEGGAIHSRTDARFINCTFSGNLATYGAAAWISGFSALQTPTNRFDNCTITQNTASYGGGIYFESNVNAGQVLFANTILADNSALVVGPECNQDAAVPWVSLDYNLFNDLTGCLLVPAANDQTTVSPLLDVLADNGGPTPTHCPMAGSPVLEAANPAGCRSRGSALWFDQRGQVRHRDNDCDLFPNCDIGAVEAPACAGGPC